MDKKSKEELLHDITICLSTIERKKTELNEAQMWLWNIYEQLKIYNNETTKEVQEKEPASYAKEA